MQNFQKVFKNIFKNINKTNRKKVFILRFVFYKKGELNINVYVRYSVNNVPTNETKQANLYRVPVNIFFSNVL